MVNGQLAERFGRKLAELRACGGLLTPSLVFHGAPSQEHLFQERRPRWLRPTASKPKPCR